MQTVSRYLLTQLVIAYINGYHGRNSKVYDRRLTLHRGVDNPVTFTFKNEDQKAQDITSKTFELNIIDSESKKAVITKTLTILDDGSTVSTKGDASCTITEGDLLPLDAKFYNFAVREVLSSGARNVTYADTGYVSAGTIELLDGAYPEFVQDVRSVMAATVNPEKPEEVQVGRASDVLEARAAAQNAFTSLFVGLGAVALLVGGIGIANVMVISVIERKNEIGLRRALGATRFHIGTQFLTESLILASVGGLVGIITGIIITFGYAMSREWSLVVPGYAIAGSIISSLLIGGIAGFYPALRAANLAPTEALRTR